MPFATPPNTVALLPAGQLVKSIDSNGSARSYILYIPDGLSADHTLALVLVLHGGLGNGETAIAMSGFNAVADKHGFLVVYPNGSGVRDDRLLSWNSGNCCGHAKQNNIDDVGSSGRLQQMCKIIPDRSQTHLCYRHVEWRHDVPAAGM